MRKYRAVARAAYVVVGCIGVLGLPGVSRAQDIEGGQPVEEKPRLGQLQPDEGKPYKEENAGAREGDQFIGLIEWSVDQKETWHPGSGPNAKPIPPVISHYTIGFRVTKGNPEADWPIDPDFRPSWRITKFGERSGELIGQEVWVAFEERAPEGQWNGTVTVECGNKITLFIPRLLPNEDEE